MKKAAKKKYDNTDKVNHPAHYNAGKIEVIEFLEDQSFGFHLGNAVKYITRVGKKTQNWEGIVEDIDKAIWYLRRFRELVVADVDQRSPCRPNEMNKRAGS